MEMRFFDKSANPKTPKPQNPKNVKQIKLIGNEKIIMDDILILF